MKCILYVRRKFEMYSSKLDRLETYYKIIIIMNYNNVLMIAKSNMKQSLRVFRLGGQG